MDKLVLASTNPGKIAELTALLHERHIEVIPQTILDIDTVEETGLTFVENALIKARHASRITHLPAIADDSGLSVAALGGAPGIYSARYAGEGATSENNINKLLADLKNIPKERRQAHFHCVLVFLSHANDPTPIICDGIWEGVILESPRGKDGFGYDPIFYVPDENKTAAELQKDVKNRLSHRGKALQLLLKQWPKYL